jgi:hypothetical protein
MRPRFSSPIDSAPDDAMYALERALERETTRVRGWVQDGAAELHVLEEEEHFFSPALHVWVAEENGMPVLRGRFGPHPHVWMLFIGIYIGLGAVGVGGLMYGISQWMLGWTPWALLLAPIALALAGFVYGAAFIGQGLGSEQMHVLRSVVENALDRAAEGLGRQG